MAIHDDMRRVSPPRDLTSTESSILALLLSRPFPGRDELRRQVQAAKVSGECACGCSSITLSIDRSAHPRAPVRHRIPVEAVGFDEDEVRIQFLSHVIDEFLAELEIFREDSGRILRLPDVRSLKLVNYWQEE